MTGPELTLTEEQVAELAAANANWVLHKRGEITLGCLISDWRTLRAALDEQVKENEQSIEEIFALRKDLDSALDRATRAEEEVKRLKAGKN